MVIFGNKSDNNDKRIIHEELRDDLSKKLNIKIFETSALKRDNVKPAFEYLLTNIIDSLKANPIEKKNTINLENI